VQPARLALKCPGKVTVTDVAERTGQSACARQLETARRPGQPVMHQRPCFAHAHPLDRHGHHDTGQARARLADDQRVHRSRRPGQFGGQVGEPGSVAGRGRIAAELRPERRVDQEPLDQLARSGVVAVSG
jgi:hypothetical protein